MSIIGEVFKDLVYALVPKEDSTEPRHVYRWRQAVCINAVIQGAAMMALTIYVLGLVPMIFGAGLTPLQQFNMVQSTLTDIRLSQIERTIREAKTDLCLGQQMGDFAIIQLAGKTIDAAQKQYYEITAKASPPNPRFAVEPPCDVLILTKK